MMSYLLLFWRLALASAAHQKNLAGLFFESLFRRVYTVVIRSCTVCKPSSSDDIEALYHHLQTHALQSTLHVT